MSAEELGLELAAGFRKDPHFERGFQKMRSLPVVLLAFSEARSREKVNWDN